MLHFQHTKHRHRQKHSLFQISDLTLRSFPLIAVLMVGMGFGALITQQVLPPSSQAWMGSTLQEKAVKVCFTPENKCTPGVIDAINLARSSICVQAYSFTSESIANALIKARERGVDVRVILDKSHLTAKSSQLNTLLQANIPVLIDKIPGIAHNKVMIIDDTYVLTGSFNFTHAADTRNTENILLLHDQELAKLYKTNWEAREKHSLPYT